MEINSPNNQELKEQADVGLESRRSFTRALTGYLEPNWSKRPLPFLYKDVCYIGTSEDIYLDGVPQKGLPEGGTALVTTRIFVPKDINHHPTPNRLLAEKYN